MNSRQLFTHSWALSAILTCSFFVASCSSAETDTEALRNDIQALQEQIGTLQTAIKEAEERSTTLEAR